MQTFFDSPLPSAEDLSNALTFHAFEIEGIENVRVRNSNMEDQALDVKVTPNRGHDALSHRGIAKEISAILKIPMRVDPLRENPPDGGSLEPRTDTIKVTVEDPMLCPRFTGAYIKGVRVGPSPEWLKTALESIGQQSINNIVDATNFIMFSLGQPLHAFDAAKLTAKRNSWALNIRLARKGETLVGLDDKEYSLSPSMLIIEDANAGTVVSIAGIKGGKPTCIDESTTDIFLEAANWDGVTVRRTSQALKLRTDASDRFQQVISPELAAYGIRAAKDLIVELAGGAIVGYVDEYPQPQLIRQITITTARINALLGTILNDEEVVDAFERLGLPFEKKGGEFVVTSPFERLDLMIPEDLVEEVARIIGYEKIPTTELPEFQKKPDINQNFAATEKVREELVSKGYSEVYTSVFADEGERAVSNKVGGERPYLRATLLGGLREAEVRNARNKELLGLRNIKLFEIGTVWQGGKEKMVLGVADDEGIHESELVSDGKAKRYEAYPISKADRFTPFSKYPFIVRDIAMWVPQGPDAISEVLTIFAQEGGLLLRHVELFDQFKKDDRISYAFHLVFQSFEKTLTDAEANEVMTRITTDVEKRGWQVR